MKNILKSIMLVAAAAIAFVSCSVEPTETPFKTSGTHRVSFIASQVDTKTTMEISNGIANFAWEKTDEEYFHIFENGVPAVETIGVIDEKNGIMEIASEFGESSAPYTYTGFMAATISNENPAVSNEQFDLGAYDPESDILVAKPVSDKQPEDISKGILFQFKRVVAINMMTLKGIPAGETVSTVSITSDKPIAGEYDFVNGEWNASETSIFITTESVANNDGQAVVYFVSAPVEGAQLTITATTAAGKTYSKELAKTITFNEGSVKAFGVTVTEEEDEYEEFTVSASINEIVSAKNYIVSSGSTIGNIITEIQLDQHLVMSTDGQPNSGSFWGTTTYDWRLYQNTQANLKFNVDKGYYIKSVKVTYNSSNGGSLFDNKDVLATNVVDKDINLSFVEYSVGSTTGKSNGQVKITAVEVVYAKGNGGQGGDKESINLTFDLSSNPGSWPTANSTTLTNYTYALDGIGYTFGLKNVKCNSGYLMCTSTAVLGLPAIEGYKLTKVVAKNSGGCSTSVNVGVSSSDSSEEYISGGAVQKWETQNSLYTYNLSVTAANTVYYLYITSKNAQITELSLTYEI